MTIELIIKKARRATMIKRAPGGRGLKLPVLITGAALLALSAACSLKGVGGPDPRTMTFPPPEFSPPRPERHTLSNQMVVYLLEDHEIPLIEGRAAVRVSAMFDPPGKTGLASLCGRLLVKGGTKGLPGSLLDEALENKAIQMGSGISNNSGSVSVNALASDTDEALHLFADVLRHPAFEEGKLELEKKKDAEGIIRLADDPDSLTFREFRRLFYAGHPRGRSATVEEVESITREEVQDFYRRHFYPDRIILGFSGDFEPEKLLQKLEDLFGDWPPSGEAPPDFPVPQKGTNDSNISLIDKDLPQASIALGHFAPPKDSADYAPFMLANYILGEGGFNSRLTREIRSNRGLAYSAGSFYRGDIGYGVYVSYVKTKNEAAPEVLDLVTGLTQEMKKNGVTPEELEWARESIINGMIFRYSSSAAVLGEAMGLEYDRLPPDFVEKVKMKIESATAEEVSAAAAKYLNPQKATVVILGKDSQYKGNWPEGRATRHLRLSPDGQTVTEGQ